MGKESFVIQINHKTREKKGYSTLSLKARRNKKGY